MKCKRCESIVEDVLLEDVCAACTASNFDSFVIAREAEEMETFTAFNRRQGDTDGDVAQQRNLERALAEHCSSQEVLLSLLRGLQNFTHYPPCLWVLVKKIRRENLQFFTHSDVSKFVADNW